LVRRPITFEETLGHHPQKATRMLSVYAFVIDDDFDVCHAWCSAAHSEVRLFVSQVTRDPEGHIPYPIKLAPQQRSLNPPGW
jgi:hypothetical protein